MLGWAAAAAIAVSILLIAAAAAAGPSTVVWPIGRTWPMPPWWFSLHPSDLSAVGAIYVAVILGAAGVGGGLLAVRRGARPAIRAVLAGAAIAVAVLTVLPPAGSTDSVSYATYGRIADIGHNPYVMTPAQLRASGDPIGLQTTRNWETDPSLYGPLATAAQWGAAKLGGTSIGRIIFWLKLLLAVAFGAIALRLAADDPTAAEVERAYRSLQAQARTAMRAHPEGGDDWTRPAEPTTTWWCPECGGLDAPQPCIGVCIKRPAEWVNHDVYERERGQALRLLELERRLRPLVRRVAFVTPRAGQWERGWRVAQAEAVGCAEVLDGATPT